MLLRILFFFSRLTPANLIFSKVLAKCLLIQQFHAMHLFAVVLSLNNNLFQQQSCQVCYVNIYACTGIALFMEKLHRFQFSFRTTKNQNNKGLQTVAKADLKTKQNQNKKLNKCTNLICNLIFKNWYQQCSSLLLLKVMFFHLFLALKNKIR